MRDRTAWHPLFPESQGVDLSDMRDRSFGDDFGSGPSAALDIVSGTQYWCRENCNAHKNKVRFHKKTLNCYTYGIQFKASSPGHGSRKIFFHPDLPLREHCRCRSFNGSCLSARGLYRRSGFSPCPEVMRSQIYHLASKQARIIRKMCFSAPAGIGTPGSPLPGSPLPGLPLPELPLPGSPLG